MEVQEIRDALHAMEQDKNLYTTSAYAANAELWPDNRISFTDKHLAYLKAHPLLKPEHYLSNLRLKIKRR
jgi:hypothetical protein